MKIKLVKVFSGSKTHSLTALILAGTALAGGVLFSNNLNFVHSAIAQEVIGGKPDKNEVKPTIDTKSVIIKGTTAGAPVEGQESTYELLNLFGDVFERIKSDYVEEVTDKNLVESAINGMLTSLDPHSGYMDAKSFKEMQVQTKGEFGGLGIEVTMEGGLVKVVTPLDGSPAFRAGIHSGDYISQIDNDQVSGTTLQQSVDKMRGKVGSSVRLTVLREGAQEPMEFTLIRETIQIQPVKSRAEGDIAYVRVNSFSEKSAGDMEAAIIKLKQDIKPAIRGLVLDLRNNPGGLLDQAINISDDFLETGEIVSTRNRNPNDTKHFSAKAGDIINGLPMVVLINNGSASASEIVAGALQDNKRAIILGTQSFGKGSVQTIIPLNNNGAMRLTTSRYYTPSGKSIQAKGITPDVVVEPSKIVPLSAQKNIRFESDLAHRLKNEDEVVTGIDKKTVSINNLQKIQDDKNNKSSSGDKNSVVKSESARDLKTTEDFQLTRALDLLHALSVYDKNKK